MSDSSGGAIGTPDDENRIVVNSMNNRNPSINGTLNANVAEEEFLTADGFQVVQSRESTKRKKNRSGNSGDRDFKKLKADAAIIELTRQLEQLKNDHQIALQKINELMMVNNQLTSKLAGGDANINLQPPNNVNYCQTTTMAKTNINAEAANPLGKTTKTTEVVNNPTRTITKADVMPTAHHITATEWSLEIDHEIDMDMNVDIAGQQATLPANKGAVPKQPGQQQQQLQRNTEKEAMDHERGQINSTTKGPTTSTGSKGKASPPVIKIYNSNSKVLISNIKERLGHNLFSLHIVNKNLINLKLNTNGDHEVIRKFLEERGVSHFTFTPRELKPVSVIIKGLSDTFDKEDLEGYINENMPELGLRNVVKLRGDRWVVQLDKSADIKAFRRLRYLLNCRVRVETHKRKGLVQCHNCQRFGHVSTNCRMPYRCVKCGQSHGAGKCEVPNREQNCQETLEKDPVTGEIVRRIGRQVHCVNCGVDGHVASSKECPKRISLLREMEERKSFARANNVNRAVGPQIGRAHV